MKIKFQTLILFLLLLLSTSSSCFGHLLHLNYYHNSCPNVESIVRAAVKLKFDQTFVTAPATLRLFFHDCFVRGCDASVLIQSTNHTSEKDNADNLSLAGDGFDTVIKAKAAVDAVPGCKNKVSCADILALATRDVVALTGGPSYTVELGRRDGRISTRKSVRHHLPQPGFGLDQLNGMFAKHGLTQTDMIALSGAHTIGFSHCKHFSKRLYSFHSKNRIDPTFNPTYVNELKKECPRNVDQRIAVDMDPMSSFTFDNVYFKNLQMGKGLFTSDQVLYSDPRSRKTVNLFASNNSAFEQAFVVAMTKLGRVGVKTRNQGEIRIDCSAVN